jgi:hypothetical protein
VTGEELRVITKNLGQGNWCFGRDSDKIEPEYKSEALLENTSSVLKLVWIMYTPCTVILELHYKSSLSVQNNRMLSFRRFHTTLYHRREYGS